MPSSGGANDALIVEAVKNGTLKKEILNQAVERILRIVFEYADHPRPTGIYHGKRSRRSAPHCGRVHGSSEKCG